MARILITLTTTNDDLRGGSWANLTIKLHDIDPIDIMRFTGTGGLPGNSTRCFVEDVPALQRREQLEYVELTHVTQESFPETADNWTARIDIDILDPVPLVSGPMHRFRGDTREQRVFPRLRQVALRAVHSNEFVSADLNRDGELIADRQNRGSWETFWLNELGNDQVALRAVSNDLWVMAQGGGGGAVLAAASEVREYETFDRLDLGDDGIALRARTGQFVGVAYGHENQLTADRGRALEHETFQVIEL